MKPNKVINWHTKTVRRSIYILILAIIVFYAVLPNLHSFGINLRLHFPRLMIYVYFAQASFLLTFLLSSLNYKFVALHQLKLIKLILVQSTSFMLELILPIGLGNIGVNYLFLRTNKHDPVQSGLIIAICNLLGVIGNTSLLLIMLLIFGISRREIILYNQLPSFSLVVIVLVIVVFIAIIGYLIAVKHHFNFAKVFHQITVYVKSYEARPSSLVFGYIAAVLQAAFTALCFWLVIKSFHLDVSYITALIIYGLSVLVGVVTPTPGGLGGIEASLVAALLAIHATNAGTAISLVLVYRLVSYWIPIGIGVISLLLIQRFKIIKWHYK